MAPMTPGLTDQMKVRLIVWARYLNHAAIEQWSKWTFRHPPQRGADGVALEPAADHYGSPGIPRALQVPREIPPASRLGVLYEAPYYYLTGALFKLYRQWPIRSGIPWTASLDCNRAFPANPEGWRDVNEDGAFALLRLQGPNPFLLRRDPAHDRYEVDYSPFFAGLFPPVVCTFRHDGRTLRPESIRIAAEIHVPASPGWERAKLIANALDARYCVFTRHLLGSHLLVGEAFALSAFSLPSAHALRSFLDLFTYGTLVVNDFAYKLLITPASYFIQSRFISVDDAMLLFRNSMAAFTLDDLIPPLDVAKRGIDQIPGHPYVEDALPIWAALLEFVRGYVGELFGDDAAVRDDRDLGRWHQALAALLPNVDVTDRPLTGRDDLSEVLSCLLYNNVHHEICGDFSTFGQALDAEHKKLVNFERLKAGDAGTQAEMADVFLFDQGAFAGRFNNGGNNLLTLAVDRSVDDPRLGRAVRGLQDRLRALDRTLEERNRTRPIPFLRMLPRKWEASISF